ncbi:MAG: nitronate monooxygenase [Flavobacteriaceae bacterium]
MDWGNELTRLLNVKYPIIQAPMLGVGTPQMVAAATRAETLGSLPLGDLPAEECKAKIQKTKAISKQPFAVNIFVHKLPELDDSLRKDYKETRKFLEKFASEHQLEVDFPLLEEIKLTDYHDQVEIIIEEEVKIVSFTFGNLDTGSIEKLKRNKTILIGTCTSLKEAKELEDSGIDIICLQGTGAGGHRGSFDEDNHSEVDGFSILSEIQEKVDIPIIYAGGIHNAKTLLAVRNLGAQGFQVGSLLLGSNESNLSEFAKERLREAKKEELILTKSFSGRYARGINNTFVKVMEASGKILPYPYQNKLTKALRKSANTHQNTEFLSLWTGQALAEFSGDSTTEILKRLISEVNNYKLK